MATKRTSRSVVRPRPAVPAGLRTRTLHAGTILYHGTGTSARFRIPSGPAWFTFSSATAAWWATEWDKGPKPRVLAFRVTSPVTLVDTGAREDRERLAERLGSDDSKFEMAWAVAASGLDGWYGEDEVMLIHPGSWLHPVEVIPLAGNKPAARSARKNPDDGYRGEHTAPSKESGSPLHDVTANGGYPEDFYSEQGARNYSLGDDRAPGIIRMVQRYRHHPGKPVGVYRAVPKPPPGIAELKAQQAHILRRGKLPPGVVTKLSPSAYYNLLHQQIGLMELRGEPKVERPKINPGDWVTLSRAYAVEHGRDNLGNRYRILSKTVRARDLYTDCDSILEWGWDP
jgi:hypothetical protein